MMTAPWPVVVHFNAYNRLLMLSPHFWQTNHIVLHKYNNMSGSSEFSFILHNIFNEHNFKSLIFQLISDTVKSYGPHFLLLTVAIFSSQIQWSHRHFQVFFLLFVPLFQACYFLLSRVSEHPFLHTHRRHESLHWLQIIDLPQTLSDVHPTLRRGGGAVVSSCEASVTYNQVILPFLVVQRFKN